MLTFELGPRDRKRLAARLSAGNSVRPVAVRTTDGEIQLPAAPQRAVEQLLNDLAGGGSVHVLVDDHGITTQRTADLLGPSRTFVVRLIDSGKLAAHHAGSHRRVRVGDALAYARRRQDRLAAVSEIAEADAAAGVAYR